MKVWVVGINVYDEADVVVGVYDSYEEAAKVQDSLDLRYTDYRPTLTEFELNREPTKREVQYELENWNRIYD